MLKARAPHPSIPALGWFEDALQSPILKLDHTEPMICFVAKDEVGGVVTEEVVLETDLGGRADGSA